LGVLYGSTDRFDEARKALLNARKIVEQTLGPADPHLAIVFESLAYVYEKTGKSQEAKEAAARAFKIRNPEKMKKPENN
jgi:hypothetical protein